MVKKKDSFFTEKDRTIFDERSFNISEEFDNIIYSFLEYVEEHDVPIKTLKSCLFARIRQPTIYEDDPQCTPEDLENEVKDISTFEKNFRPYCSFFNFTLLERLIERARYKDGLQLMKTYKKNFEEYLRKVNISQIPHGVGTDRDKSSKQFVVELSDCFKSCRGVFVIRLIKDLRRVFHIEESCLELRIIKDCSVHVVFQVFQSLENVFPLSDKTKNALKSLSYGDAQVIAIGYDGIVYNINREGKFSGMRQILDFCKTYVITLYCNLTFHTLHSYQSTWIHFVHRVYGELNKSTPVYPYKPFSQLQQVQSKSFHSIYSIVFIPSHIYLGVIILLSVSSFVHYLTSCFITFSTTVKKVLSQKIIGNALTKKYVDRMCPKCCKKFEV